METRPAIVYAVALITLLIGAAMLTFGPSEGHEVAKAIVYTSLGGLFGSAVVQRRV